MLSDPGVADSLNTLVPPGHLQSAPGPIPDRVVLVLTQNPADSQTVNWRTNYAVEEARAQITVADDGPGLHLTAREAVGDTLARTSDSGLAHHQSLTFTGLEPDTLYAYRVRGLGEGVQLYQHIEVEAERIRFESRTVTGNLYDAFDLVRRDDGSKALEERLPPGQPQRICTNPEPPRETRCWQGTELLHFQFMHGAPPEIRIGPV
ncbi:MAG: fibronectin type III domain-containing protein [Wenzhouxiangella sp.]|nr:fibronectin type III domain-containing protein [Wenzhouxiangella sp.]